jgi:hypothetical protein
MRYNMRETRELIASASQLFCGCLEIGDETQIDFVSIQR